MNYHSNDSGIRTSNLKTAQKAIPSILIPEWFPQKRAHTRLLRCTCRGEVDFVAHHYQRAAQKYRTQEWVMT